MTFDFLQDVNYLAALVAAAAWFVLGALWYSPPLFANHWQKAGGIEFPEGAGLRPVLFVVNFIAYFVAAIAMAMLAAATGTDTIGEGFVLGAVVGLGFALPAVGVISLYERKPEPAAYFLITGIYNTLGVIILAVIISAFG